MPVGGHPPWEHPRCRPNANRERQGLGDGVSMPWKREAAAGMEKDMTKDQCERVGCHL